MWKQGNTFQKNIYKAYQDHNVFLKAQINLRFQAGLENENSGNPDHAMEKSVKQKKMVKFIKKKKFLSVSQKLCELSQR